MKSNKDLHICMYAQNGKFKIVPFLCLYAKYYSRCSLRNFVDVNKKLASKARNEETVVLETCLMVDRMSL